MKLTPDESDDLERCTPKKGYTIQQRRDRAARAKEYRRANKDGLREKSQNKAKERTDVQKQIRAAKARAYRRANKETLREKRMQNREKAAAYYQANKDRVAVIGAAYRTKNKEARRIKQAEYRRKNKERISFGLSLKRAKNVEKFRLRSRRYYQKNKKYYTAKDAKRRATKLQRTPKWANLKAIAAFYEACPPGYHVDHICPLQGKNVSGLHVIDNLQYLTAAENISKGNKFDPVEGSRYAEIK